MELELRINGVIESIEAAPNETLQSILRREGQCSVKQGCGTGECGACAVLVDGIPRPSCVVLAGQAGGCTLTTVQGLGSTDKLHPLQEAFFEVGAARCGYCTPGMLLAAYALLQRTTNPTEEEVRDALSGNTCHCTGYLKPVQGVMRAAAKMRGESLPPIEYHVLNADISQATTTGKNHPQSLKSAGSMTAATAKIPALTLGSSMLPAKRSEAMQGVIGKPVQGSEMVRSLTGVMNFTSDVSRSDMLYGRVLTCPHPHAVIRDIDISEAKALPSVQAVLTYRDVPRVPFSSVERSIGESGPFDQYVLDFHMRYVGDRVAVVAADTVEIAEQALQLIQVEYDVLPSLLDPRQALEPNAPRLHPESESQGIYDVEHNIAARVRMEVGNVDAGFAAADLVVEDEYIVPAIPQVPLEKHAVITYFDEDDCLVVRTDSESPQHVRRTLARILNLPLQRIRVVQPEAGDNPGTRQAVILEDVCALLTLTTRRPVALAYSPEAAFSSSPIRQQHIIRLKTGVKRDGALTAQQMMVLASTGAYGTHPLSSQYEVPAEVLMLYPAPNMRYAAQALYTNMPPALALRGHGAAHEFYALESQMDEVARRLNMDPLELRRKNWLEVGDAFPLLGGGHTNRGAQAQLASGGLPECLRLVEEKLQWHARRGRVSNGTLRRGVGVAFAMHGTPFAVPGISGAIMRLNQDGSFTVAAPANGAAERTILAQIAAEVLAVPMDKITVHSNNTDMVPDAIGESALSTLYLSGGAVKKAAEQVRRQILAVAGRLLGSMPEALRLNAGVITAAGGKSVSIEQVAASALYVENRHIMTTASWKQPHAPTAFVAQGAEVEVDIETGVVRVIKVVTAVDVGCALNPVIAEGQIEGQVTHGLALSIGQEALYNQKGEPAFNSLSDFHFLSAAEMPELETHIVETMDSAGPFGAKEIVDLPSLATAPAIMNAVADATGVRIYQLPLTPERVLRTLRAQQASVKA